MGQAGSTSALWGDQALDGRLEALEAERNFDDDGQGGSAEASGSYFPSHLRAAPIRKTLIYNILRQAMVGSRSH